MRKELMQIKMHMTQKPLPYHGDDELNSMPTLEFAEAYFEAAAELAAAKKKE